MTLQTNDLGKLGELIVERWLVSQGWGILHRRFRTGHRDIDLVTTAPAETSTRTVVFVEIKTRSSSLCGGPLSAVGWKKQRELRRSANIWIDRMGQRGDEYRFDVVGVLIGPAKPDIQHIENAFLVPNRP